MTTGQTLPNSTLALRRWLRGHPRTEVLRQNLRELPRASTERGREIIRDAIAGQVAASSGVEG